MIAYHLIEADGYPLAPIIVSPQTITDGKPLTGSFTLQLLNITSEQKQQIDSGQLWLLMGPLAVGYTSWGLRPGGQVYPNGQPVAADVWPSSGVDSVKFNVTSFDGQQPEAVGDLRQPFHSGTYYKLLPSVYQQGMNVGFNLTSYVNAYRWLYGPGGPIQLATPQAVSEGSPLPDGTYANYRVNTLGPYGYSFYGEPVGAVDIFFPDLAITDTNRTVVYQAPYYIAPDAVYVYWQNPPSSWKIETAPVPTPQQILDLAKRDGLPQLNLQGVDAPSITAAGLPFSAIYNLVNSGAPGKATVNVSPGNLSQQLDVGSTGTITTFSQSLSMPFAPLVQPMQLNINAQTNQHLIMTSFVLKGNSASSIFSLPKSIATGSFRSVIQVQPGFPNPQLGTLGLPSAATPGAALNISAPVTNDGYQGTMGVRVSVAGLTKDITEMASPGDKLDASFAGQMPVAPSVQMSVVPIYVGQDQQLVEGDGDTFTIPATDFLFQDASMATMRGGGPITGFVAGKNVRISGISSVAGTGGPPGLPYGGYFLSGTISDTAVITYDELYYLKYVTTNSIATARLGTLISRAVTSYEYSSVPTPSMALNGVRAVNSLFTQPRSTTASKFPTPVDVMNALRTGLP